VQKLEEIIDTSCKTNKDCGKGEVCYEVAKDFYFGHNDSCNNYEGGCHCRKQHSKQDGTNLINLTIGEEKNEIPITITTTDLREGKEPCKSGDCAENLDVSINVAVNTKKPCDDKDKQAKTDLKFLEHDLA
jgi:hypothetical protein